MKNWKIITVNVLGMCVVVGTIALGISTIGKTAISEMAGLAVAQSNTQWNNVKDASQGDGLTSGILAQSSYLFNGLTFDRLRSAPAADGSSGTGLLAQVGMLFNGTTYDRIRGGLTTDDNAVTGLVNNAQLVFDGTNYDRVRQPTADALAVTGLVGSPSQIFNGTTWDRERSASVDNLTNTGIQSGGNVSFDGTTWDRVLGISNTNNTATTSQGVRYSTQLSTWNITNSANAGTPTVSRAAGGGTVRHVTTALSACVGAAGTAQPVVQVNLRDGATGAGTIIRSWQLAGIANTNACINESGLNITGSANTAMTIEFAAATAAATQATVNLSGYSTP